MADEQYTTVDSMNIAKLKVSDLKRELKSRGLNATGNKIELVNRLSEALQSGKNDDGSADSVDELIDEDDVLNDDEIEQEVGNMKNIELEVSDRSFETESTNNEKPTKRKNFELGNNDSKECKSAKKIVLNRKLSTDAHSDSSMTATETANGNSDEKKVIKLSELSAKERLEMRAKKFGTPLSVEAKKEVRAQRFGQSNSATDSNKTTITINSSAPAPNLDVLKKRAERFGTVSTQLLKVETQEKLEKRKERFGTATATATATATTEATATNGSSSDILKAKRLERFKTTLK